MIEKNPELKTFRAYVAKTIEGGRDTIWEEKHFEVTSYSVDENGCLHFWQNDTLIHTFASGQWQQVSLIDI